MAAALTYGGVPLGVVGSGSGLGGALWRWAKRQLPSAVVRQEAVAQWVEHNVSPREVYEFAYRSAWPGPNLAGLTFQPWVPTRPVRPGTLFWPVGASRWAVGHFIATGAQVDAILPLAYGNASPWKPTPLNLVLDTGRQNQSITASMYLLPPRPLQRTG